MARPSKLTPERQARIVALIQAGNYAEVAAANAGIERSTYFRWMQQGREATAGMYREFHDAIKAAETHAEVRAVALVQKHMADNWQAAMTYLERKFPARWRRPQQHEHSGPNGQAIPVAATVKVDVSKLSDEDLELLDEIERKAGV